MADRELKIRFTAEGESKTQQAIKGTSRAARQAAKEQAQAAKEKAREEAKAAKEAAAAAKRAAQEKVRADTKAAKDALAAQRKAQREAEQAAKRSTKAQLDEVKKAERAKRAEFERTRRAQERARAKAEREAERARQRWQQHQERARESSSLLGAIAGNLAGMAGAGTVLGALRSLIGAAVEQQAGVRDAMGQRGGVQDIPERVVSAADFQLELTRLGGEVFGELDPEERRRQLASVQDEILRIAQATNQAPGPLLEALSTLQTEFSAFEFGRENLEALADEATRTGSEVQQLARFAGLVRQQFGEMGVDRILDITAQGGLQGALTTEQLSGEFAEQLGNFRRLVDPSRQQDPEQLFRQFVAMANVVRSSGANAAGSAVATQNLLAALGEEDVQARIALATGGRFMGRRMVNGRHVTRVRGGVQLRDFRDQNGQLDLAGFTEALAATEGFGDQESLSRIEGMPQQAAMALATIIARRRDELAGTNDDNADFRELMSVSAEAGGAFRAANLLDVRQTAAMEAEAVGVRSQVEGIKNLAPRADEANKALNLRESLRSSGFFGQFVGSSDWLMAAASAVQGTGVGRALQNEKVAGIADWTAGIMYTAGAASQGERGIFSTLGQAYATESERTGIKASTGLPKSELADAFRGALDQRPVRVEVINPTAPAAAAAASGPDPRRSSSPRARTGR